MQYYKNYLIIKNDMKSWAVYKNKYNMDWKQKEFQGTTKKSCIKFIDDKKLKLKD